MDESIRRAFIQGLYNYRPLVQDTQVHMQPGQGPPGTPNPPGTTEQPGTTGRRTFHPNPHPSNTRLSTPAPLSRVAQPQTPVSATAQPTGQRTTIFLPNGNISFTAPSTPQLGRPILQQTYQPVQQQLGFGLGTPPSTGNTNQSTHQPNQLRYGPPHRRFSHGPVQPRHHPYEAPQSRPPHGPSRIFYPQNIPQIPPRGDLTSSTARTYDPAQPHLFTTPQAPQPTDLTLPYFPHGLQRPQITHEISQPQHHILSQTTLPAGLASPLPPRDPAQIHVRHTSQGSSSGGPSSSRPYPPSPSQWNSTTQSRPGNKPQAPLPSTPEPLHLTQTPPLPILPLPPPTPRVWYPQLHTITYVPLPLQAQPQDEAKHANQKKLLIDTQKRSLDKLRPHEFIDCLTMDYNKFFKPKVAKIYDILFMQALLFHNDHVLLITPTKLQPPCWAPPQSVWHAYDLSKFPHAQIEAHVLKALNVVSDLQPDEVISCAGLGRHDSAVDLVKANGELTHGWSVALSFEMRKDGRKVISRNLCREFQANAFDEEKIRDLNMDPVWKAKVLEIMKLRREARNT